MSISPDYEDDDNSCPSVFDCQHLHEFSQFMSRELISSLQREFGSLPQSELNQSMRGRILQMVTRIVPRVQQDYQTANSTDLTHGAPNPSFDANVPSLDDMLHQEDLPMDGTLTINNRVPEMFPNLLSPIPWVENIEHDMPPYADFPDSSRLY